MLYFIFIFSVVVFACAEPWSIALLQILIACLLAIVTWGGKLSVSGPIQRWLVPAILMLVAIGILQLGNPHPSTYPNTTIFFTTSAWATKNAILLWTSYAALLLSASSVIQEPIQVRRLCWLVFGLCVFTAAAGLGIRSENASLLLGFRKLEYEHVLPFGPFVNRDHAAAFLAMGGLMGWGLFFSQLPGLRDSRYRTKFFDSLAIATLSLVMVVAIAFCLVKTGSRGGTHSFFLASGIMGFLAATFFTKGKWRLLSYLGLVSAWGIYAFLLSYFPQWRGYVDGEWIGSLQWRVSMYRSGIAMLRDSPITGTGLGSFMHGFPSYQEPLVTGVVEHIHGDWLETILQVGVIGFLLLTGAFTAIIGIGLRRWLRCPSRELRALTGGALGGVIALSIHMCMEFPFQIPANAVTIMLLLCIIASQPILEGKWDADYDRPRPLRPSNWLKVLVGGVAIALIGFSIPPILAESSFYLGKRSADSSKIYYFAQAARLDPNPKYAAALGQTYSKLADSSPFARITLWRAALEATAPFEHSYPLQSRLRHLREYSVYSLERDARR